jgi:hypothetical protein
VLSVTLQVEPFASLATLPSGSVPRILLNRELVGPFKHRGRGRPTDVAVTGDLVESVMTLARGAGWERELCHLCGYEEERGEEGEVDEAWENGGEGCGVKGGGGSQKEEVGIDTPNREEGDVGKGESGGKERTNTVGSCSGNIFTTQPAEMEKEVKAPVSDAEELVSPLSALTLEQSSSQNGSC